MKILWLSRHEMTEQQKKDFIKNQNFLNDEELKVFQKNVTWHASDNRPKDFKENSKIIETFNKYCQKNSIDYVCGVFPPVSLEVIWGFNYPVFTPISVQEKSLRDDGSS